MNRNNVLNLLFIGLFILFAILSFSIDFFFFIPIICFLPFSFRTNRENKIKGENKITKDFSFQNSKDSIIRYCPRCGGEVSKLNAKFCYHCGEKLNKI